MPIPHPSQNGRKRFPAWRRKNGLISASDEELEWESEWFEQWALRSAGILIIGLLAELAEAYLDPPHESAWGRWGGFWATLLVVVGVWGEVAFARMGARRSEELTRRSKKRAAEANERAAKAELELAKIKLPRQWDTIVAGAKIKPFAGTSAAMAISVDEPEQWHVADLMYATLQQGGWVVADWWPGQTVERWPRFARERPVRIGTKSGLSSAIMITPAYGDKTGEAVGALTAALREQGITVLAFPMYTEVHKHVTIAIGSKI